MKRVALYARVSTEEQAMHGYSIGAQVDALREYSKQHNYYIVGEYVDEGISARKSYKKRPALLELLQAVQDDRVDLILFIKLDRWFRNVAAYYQVQPVLEEHNVAWQAILEDYETLTASGRMKVNIMLSVAENEADRTSERIRFVQDAKRAKGEPLNDKAPVGFVYDPNEKCFKEDQNTIQAAKDVFQWFIDTRSVKETRNRLYEKHGIMRADATIREMLKNKFYISVIGRDQFQKAQELISSRSQRNTRSGNVYMFSGLLYCKECGARMKASRARGKAYYSCFKHSEYGNYMCLNSKHTSEEKIESFLITNVEKAIKDYNIRITKNATQPKDTAKIKKKMEKLKDLYLEDLISKEVYERDYRALEKDLYLYQPSTQISVDDVNAALAKYRELTTESKKAFWSRIIRRIESDRDGNIFLIT